MKPVITLFLTIFLSNVSVGLPAAQAADKEAMGKNEMQGMDKKSMGGMNMKAEKAAASGSHHGSGTVKAVNPAEATVTISHGPIKSLDWPAMTMAFKTRDKQAASRLKYGDKVEFTLEKSGADYVITDIK